MSLKEKFNSKFRINKNEQLNNFVFDENSFDMRVEGGPTQSKPIRISAVMNMGEMKGKPLDLSCKWFNKTNNDIRQIVGITGQSYQPCISDVGTMYFECQYSLHIQCVPSLPGKQYEGMPLIKEIGPLTVDTESEQEAKEHIETHKATFFMSIMSFAINGKESKPSDGFLKLQDNRVILEKKSADDSRTELISVEMTEDYPNYVLNRLNTREMKVEFSKDQHAVLLAQDHLVRDVICLTSKMMSANKIVEKLNSEESLSAPTSPGKRVVLTTATGDLLQLGELTKQNRQLLVQKEQLEKKYGIEKEQKEAAQQKKKQIEQRLENLNRNYFALEEEIKLLKEQKTKMQLHQTYEQNEIKIARAENVNLANELQVRSKSLQQCMEKLKRFQQQQQARSYEQLQKTLETVQSDLASLNSHVAFLTTQRQKQQEASKADIARIEQLQNQLSYLEKKHASLASQKIEQLTSLDQSHELKMLEERDKLREREVLKLQDQVKALIEENNELRLQSPTKSEKPGAPKKPKKSEMVEVQKVANRLAEAITQKDMIIQQQKEVNRQLIERLAAYERKSEKQLGTPQKAEQK